MKIVGINFSFLVCVFSLTLGLSVIKAAANANPGNVHGVTKENNVFQSVNHAFKTTRDGEDKKVLASDTSKIPITIGDTSTCSLINWASWSDFTGTSTIGKVKDFDGTMVDITMSSNFQFGSTPQIFDYKAFNKYPSPVLNTAVPKTTWSKGAGGTTTMCFSKTVSNPVLLIASLGNPDTTVNLNFSLPYVVLYNGGGMKFNDSNNLSGREGYAIIMFPGDFTCVTINSTTPEYYTNITWGLRPPPFAIDIAQVAADCSEVKLTASGGVTYKWNGGDTPNSATNTFHKDGTYIVTVTNQYGCTTSTSKTIKMETAPVAAITGNGKGCDAVTLTASGGATYLWSGGDTPNNATNTFHTSGTYQVLVTSEYGCSSSASAVVTINGDVAPSVQIIANTSKRICIGTPVTFTAEGTNSGPTPFYQWYKNDIAIATGETYTAQNLADNDKISCQLISSALCATPLTTASNAITVTVSPMPVIAVDTDYSVSSSTSVQISPLVTGAQTYLWIPSTGLSNPAVRNPIANPKVTTTYVLQVTSPDGCVTFADITVKVVPDFTVYNTFSPNGDGTNETWNIPNIPVTAVVDVYNRLGERLFHSIGYGTPWDGNFNGKGLPAGTYYYVIDPKDSNYKTRSGWVALLR